MSERPRPAWLWFWEGAVRFIEEAVPSLALFVMFVVVVYQIFMRDVLTKPSTWSDELARYLYIYIVFLGAAHVSRRRAQIRMDVVPSHLAGRARTLLLLVHEAAILAFLVYALRSGITFYQFYGHISMPSLGRPAAYLIIIVPVVCVLMMIHHLGSAAGLVRSLRSP